MRVYVFVECGYDGDEPELLGVYDEEHYTPELREIAENQKNPFSILDFELNTGCKFFPHKTWQYEVSHTRAMDRMRVGAVDVIRSTEEKWWKEGSDVGKVLRGLVMATDEQHALRLLRAKVVELTNAGEWGWPQGAAAAAEAVQDLSLRQRDILTHLAQGDTVDRAGGDWILVGADGTVEKSPELAPAELYALTIRGLAKKVQVPEWDAVTRYVITERGRLGLSEYVTSCK